MYSMVKHHLTTVVLISIITLIEENQEVEKQEEAD